jgi:hypothetical protein
MMKNAYSQEQILKLKAWSKLAFTDPAAMQGGGGAPPMEQPMGQPMMSAPQGGAPPVDPATGLPIDPATGMPIDPNTGQPIDPAMLQAMMQGGGGAPPMDPAAMGGAPPMDPAAMGGAPPMDPAAMGGAPPADPSMQAMGDQEAMRSIIREEIQKAMGGGDAGQGIAAPAGAKKGNKMDEAMASLKDELKEQQKILVAVLRQNGIEIPLADLYAIEEGQLPAKQQGASETMQPGMNAGGGDQSMGKLGSFSKFTQDVDTLTKLANLKESLQKSALRSKLVKEANVLLPEMNYLAGLYR